MKHFFSLVTTIFLLVFNLYADYTDIPWTVSNGQFTINEEGTNYTFSIRDGYYQEWDHYVIFWSTGYGSNTNASSIGSGNYSLNLAEMKTYAEKCYETYTTLGFVDPLNLGNKSHKIIILAYYDTNWHATGSGYGDYGTLNIAHSSVNGDYYTYCHEIAHAYQYLGYNLNGGNAGFQYGDMYGYVSYYECSANWQASQIYKQKHFPQLNPVFLKTTNLAFGHQWHCYQSYPMNDYFTEMRETSTVGKIWTVNTNQRYADPIEKYMSLYNLDANEVYKEFFWAAMRMVTWDMDRWQSYLQAEGVSHTKYMDHTPGTKAGVNATSTPVDYSDNYYRHCSTYQYVTTDAANAIHQVAYSSCPQSTGFNIIKLNVPTGSNRTVTTTFTALTPGCSLANGDQKEYWCGSMWAKASSITNYNSSATSECNSNFDTYKSWRGFRLGYVTYNKSTGERKYNYKDEVFCNSTNSVNFQFEVPENVDSLYLVVSPALSQYLRMGSQNPYEISSNDGYIAAQKERDQWPYTVQFYNTNIYGLNNPSTSFNGTAVTGTTYTTDQLPDMGSGEAEQNSGDKSIVLTKNVSIDNSDNQTNSSVVSLTADDLSSIASAFSLSSLDNVELVDYAVSQNANTIMFLPATTSTQLSEGISNCTDNTYLYGHYFDEQGNLSSESDWKLAVQFNPSNKEFNVKMNTSDGTYTVCEALRYFDGTNYSTVYFKFVVSITGTIHYNLSTINIEKSVSFPTSSTEYNGATVVLDSTDLATIADCFGQDNTFLKSENNWESWSSQGPTSGKITLYAVDPDGVTLHDTCSSANGYGHWFNVANVVCAYNSGSYVFSEYDVTSTTFTIGQMPNVLSDGDQPTITQAIVYINGLNKYVAYIHFNITIGETESSLLTDIANLSEIVTIYSLSGIRLNKLQKGLNIIKLSNGTVKLFYLK